MKMKKYLILFCVACIVFAAIVESGGGGGGGIPYSFQKTLRVNKLYEMIIINFSFLCSPKAGAAVAAAMAVANLEAAVAGLPEDLVKDMVVAAEDGVESQEEVDGHREAAVGVESPAEADGLQEAEVGVESPAD